MNVSPKDFHVKDPSRHIILQVWVWSLLTRQEVWTVLVGILWDHYLKTIKSNGSYLSIWSLQGWMEPPWYGAKREVKPPNQKRVSVLSSQWLQGLTHRGFLDMQGSFSRKPPTALLTALLQLCLPLSSGGDFIILHVVDAAAHRHFPKGLICLALVFHEVSIHSLQMEEILPLLPPLHWLRFVWVIPDLHRCFALLSSV